MKDRQNVCKGCLSLQTTITEYEHIVEDLAKERDQAIRSMRKALALISETRTIAYQAVKCTQTAIEAVGGRAALLGKTDVR